MSQVLDFEGSAVHLEHKSPLSASLQLWLGRHLQNQN